MTKRSDSAQEPREEGGGHPGSGAGEIGAPGPCGCAAEVARLLDDRTYYARRAQLLEDAIRCALGHGYDPERAAYYLRAALAKVEEQRLSECSTDHGADIGA